MKNGPQVDWQVDTNYGTKVDRITAPSESRVSATAENRESHHLKLDIKSNIARRFLNNHISDNV